MVSANITACFNPRSQSKKSEKKTAWMSECIVDLHKQAEIF